MRFEIKSTRVIRMEKEQIIILNGKNNKVIHLDTITMEAELKSEMIRENRTGFKVIYDWERKFVYAIGGHNLSSNRILYPYVHQYDI